MYVARVQNMTDSQSGSPKHASWAPHGLPLMHVAQLAAASTSVVNGNAPQPSPQASLHRSWRHVKSAGACGAVPTNFSATHRTRHAMSCWHAP